MGDVIQLRNARECSHDFAGCGCTWTDDEDTAFVLALTLPELRGPTDTARRNTGTVSPLPGSPAVPVIGHTGASAENAGAPRPRFFYPDGDNAA